MRAHTRVCSASALTPSCARHPTRSGKALQGNLDPCELFGTRDTIRAAVRAMLVGFGDAPLVGNLGHGMLPSHKPEALGEFFAAVHEISAELRGGATA